MSVLDKMGVREVADFQQKLFWAALRAMQIGIRIDLEARTQIAQELQLAADEVQVWVETVLGHKINLASPQQIMKLFYDDFQQKVVMSRAKPGNPSHPTSDDEALDAIAKREPLLKPLCNKILHWRSLSTLTNNFMEARLDEYNRMGTSFNICGTETYRFSSGENAFGVGMNLQNIPHKGSKSYLKAIERGETFPNVKRMFIPDEGYTFFEIDLERADLHVVIWEADDKEMKQILREGVDIHTENAKLLGCNRELAKSWVHGTNYGSGAHTMSATCGITVATAENMRRRWFQAHPGILRWHDKVQKDLARVGVPFVSNKFGYRRYYFDRRDTLFTKALAWIPQSTVACVINRAWVNLYENLQRDVLVLLQVHDSLAGQYPTDRAFTVELIQQYCQIPIPYPDPLVIPTSLKTSTKSWGECGAEL